MRAPVTFHSVYCLGVSPTPPGGLERPVMCDTCQPCVYRVWNKCISRTWTAIVFVLFLELGPRVHWSRDELWAGALRSMGDCSGESGRSKNHTQREGSYLPRNLGSRGKRRGQIVLDFGKLTKAEGQVMVLFLHGSLCKLMKNHFHFALRRLINWVFRVLLFKVFKMVA